MRRMMKSEWIAGQLREARAENFITTRTGTHIPLWLAYKCLYCGEFFSQSGAEKHFGQTRIEHNKGKLMGMDSEIEVEAGR